VGGAQDVSDIVAFDAETGRLFVTNGARNRIDSIDVASVDSLSLAFSVSDTGLGGAVNGVLPTN